MNREIELLGLTRSRKYEISWVLEHALGPNPIWLVDYLTQSMDIPTGAKILDLGCGKAVTSIFLAKEYAATVFAVDLNVNPSSNHSRIQEMGLEDQVIPLKCDARSLPFADDYFDVVVSCNAYYLFGTDALYFGYLSQMVMDGGLVGFINPGHTEESGGVPSKEIFVSEFNGPPLLDWTRVAFRSAKWWRKNIERSGLARVLVSDEHQSSWRMFHESEKQYLRERGMDPDLDNTVRALEIDAGEFFTFPRVVAKVRKSSAGGAIQNIRDAMRPEDTFE